MTDDSPVLVGELNPYGSRPEYALYPLPERASGHRLQTLVLGIGTGDYVRLARHNLCVGKWSIVDARGEAMSIVARYPGRAIVLLGAKVASAFVPFVPAALGPFEQSGRFVLLPHPSGLCRTWNDPMSFARARAAVAVACPEWAERVGITKEARA